MTVTAAAAGASATEGKAKKGLFGRMKAKLSSKPKDESPSADAAVPTTVEPAAPSPTKVSPETATPEKVRASQAVELVVRRDTLRQSRSIPGEDVCERCVNDARAGVNDAADRFRP